MKIHSNSLVYGVLSFKKQIYVHCHIMSVSKIVILFSQKCEEIDNIEQKYVH